MLTVNEFFYSIQGEGTRAGLPCVFIRLTWCNLRCTYCDTEYAFYEGSEFSIEAIIEKVRSYNCSLVELTGGEPLIQSEAIPLMTALCDAGYEVLIETGGSLPIDKIDQRVSIIMDLKCPSSGMQHKNRYENLNYLKSSDELKFVIGSEEDFNWAVAIINRYSLQGKMHILFSPVFGAIEPQWLAERILADSLPVRFQLQMHKFIWDPARKGV